MAGAPLSASEAALIEGLLALTARRDERETCTAMLDVVQRIFEARACWILLHDAATDELLTAKFRGAGAEAYAEVRVPCDRGIVGLAFRRQETVFVPDAQEEERWYDAERVKQSGLRSVFTVPLVFEGDAVGVVGLDSAQFTADCPPQASDVARLRAIGAAAAAGIRTARHLASVEQDRQRLRQLLDERRQLRHQVGHLREQIRDAHGTGGVIGHSSAFQAVVEQVAMVAPADSTVLLVGETGTGKEMFARAVHEQSRRARAPFVAVNCAALPDTLVESELFGHEKGSFTGALSRTPGKFEIADRGTLFLDEIGDLPLPAQAKLLRVLQEREVQRIGGVRPVPVNVRLIAATNQDLEARMRAGQFRPDLFYRLSVFPIRLPPLRERRDDIPALVAYFLRVYAERLHKPLPQLAPGVLDRLVAYEWPGNVRELQNVIERAVILAHGGLLRDDVLVLHDALTTGAVEPAPVDAGARPARASDTVVNFSEAERRAIVHAVEMAGWRISGRGGAAEILGLKPTTLHAKMKKLGIHRPTVSVDGVA